MKKCVLALALVPGLGVPEGWAGDAKGGCAAARSGGSGFISPAGGTDGGVQAARKGESGMLAAIFGSAAFFQPPWRSLP